MRGGVGNEIPPCDWGNSVILLNIAPTLQGWKKKNAFRAHLIASKLPIIFPQKNAFCPPLCTRKETRLLLNQVKYSPPSTQNLKEKLHFYESFYDKNRNEKGK